MKVRWEQVTDDRRGALVHFGLGLLFPIGIGCLVSLLQLAMQHQGYAIATATAVVGLAFYPANKMAEALSGPNQSGSSLLTRALPLFLGLLPSTLLVFSNLAR